MKMFRMISGRSLAAVGLLVTLACSLAGQQLAQLPGLSLVGALVLALLLGMALQGARGLHHGRAHLDEGEFLNVERHTLDELADMSVTDRLPDVKTAVAVLKTKLLLSRTEDA